MNRSLSPFALIALAGIVVGALEKLLSEPVEKPPHDPLIRFIFIRQPVLAIGRRAVKVGDDLIAHPARCFCRGPR